MVESSRAGERWSLVPSFIIVFRCKKLLNLCGWQRYFNREGQRNLSTQTSLDTKSLSRDVPSKPAVVSIDTEEAACSKRHRLNGKKIYNLRSGVHCTLSKVLYNPCQWRANSAFSTPFVLCGPAADKKYVAGRALFLMERKLLEFHSNVPNWLIGLNVLHLLRNRVSDFFPTPPIRGNFYVKSYNGFQWVLKNTTVSRGSITK